MAEMQLDELSHGSHRINSRLFINAGYEASKDAASKYMRGMKIHDPALWTKEQWDLFIWQILSAGVKKLIDETDTSYREAMRSIDEIPY